MVFRTIVRRSFGSTTAISHVTVKGARPASSLAGGIKAHDMYVLLHTPTSPTTYPKILSSKLQRELQLRLGPSATVNFSYPRTKDHTGATASQPINYDIEPSSYTASAWSALGGETATFQISSENLDDMASRLSQGMAHPRKDSSSTSVHLYVCTHGQRDCRCGEKGTDLIHRLEAELEKMKQESPEDSRLKNIVIGEVGHVGGHKWAANLLVFPHGEWLGNLEGKHARWVLESIIQRHEASAALPAEDAPLCPAHWRGRMGMSKEEMLKVAEKIETYTDPLNHVYPK